MAQANKQHFRHILIPVVGQYTLKITFHLDKHKCQKELLNDKTTICLRKQTKIRKGYRIYFKMWIYADFLLAVITGAFNRII